MMVTSRHSLDTESDAPGRLFKYGLATLRDKRLLLCKPHAFPELIMPGGVRENSETHVVGLLREVREELGPAARLDESSLRWFGHFEDLAAGLRNTIVEMDVYLGDLFGDLHASSEIAELIWFGRDDDPLQLSPVIRNKIWPALLAQELV